MKYPAYLKETVSCRECGWSDLGSECVNGEIYDACWEICCPACGETIAVIDFPLAEDLLDDPDASELDRKQARVTLSARDRFERTKLKDASQLPDLEGDRIYLVWDTDDYQRPNEVLVRYGSQIVWREPAFFENYERFEAIGRIAKEKYGDRLWDMFIAPVSTLMLYGDRIGSPDRLGAFRREVLWPVEDDESAE